jgi:LmbE family N-acetylglucosaminyl deacetylase
MSWIYLSPHPDDVALSCGGLLWGQSQRGETTSVWTVCAGDPPAGALSSFARQLHSRWGVGRHAMAVRRKEDQASCALIGAAYKHFPIPDCIYRRSPVSGMHLYTSETAIFGSMDSAEAALLADLCGMIKEHLPPQTQLVCPLGLGGHVDHRLTRATAELLDLPLWYYADYPYVLSNAQNIPRLLPTGWEEQVFELSEAELQAWVESVAAHKSQISTFWSDTNAMQAAIRRYYQESGGVRLWRPPG